MDKRDVMREAKSIVLNNKGVSFQTVIKSINSVDKLVSALIYTLGYEAVTTSESNDEVTFRGEIAGGSQELLTFNRSSSHLDGVLKADIEQAFELISAIEYELSDAMMFPQDMRQKIINDVQNRVGVSSDRYETILKNWKVN